MRHSNGLRAAAGNKAIALINTSFVSLSNNTAITGNKPANTNENDLLIAILADYINRTYTPPSGWTEVLDNGRLNICYKIAGASEPSTYTWTPSAGTRSCLLICTYRNAAYDTIGTVSTTVSGTTQTAPAITLASSGSTLFAVFAAASSNNLSYSNQTAGLNVLLSDSDSNTPSMTVYTQDNVSSGSTGNKSADASATPINPSCVLFGIKPS